MSIAPLTKEELAKLMQEVQDELRKAMGPAKQSQAPRFISGPVGTGPEWVEFKTEVAPDNKVVSFEDL